MTLDDCISSEGSVILTLTTILDIVSAAAVYLVVYTDTVHATVKRRVYEYCC